MFEQSTVSSESTGKRFWTTCIGFTGQAGLAMFAVLAPLVVAGRFARSISLRMRTSVPKSRSAIASTRSTAAMPHVLFSVLRLAASLEGGRTWVINASALLDMAINSTSGPARMSQSITRGLNVVLPIPTKIALNMRGS